MNRILLLFLLLVICIGCNKNDVGLPGFPHTLLLKSVEEKNKTRLFIGSEEIYDISIINKYISKSVIFQQNLKEFDPTSQIVFLSKDTAVFSAQTTKFGLVLKEDLFLFYSPMVFGSTGQYPFSEIRKYVKEDLPIVNGHSTLQDVRVGYGTYYSLKLSFMRYVLTRSDEQNVDGEIRRRFEMSAETIFNEFNPSCVSKLTSHDTLAVQEFVLLMQ